MNTITTLPQATRPHDEVAPAGAAISDAEIDRVAWIIERDGLAGLDDAIDGMGERAARAGASPVLIGVLTDPSAPENARIRAFGLLALRVAGEPRSPRLAA